MQQAQIFFINQIPIFVSPDLVKNTIVYILVALTTVIHPNKMIIGTIGAVQICHALSMAEQMPSLQLQALTNVQSCDLELTVLLSQLVNEALRVSLWVPDFIAYMQNLLLHRKIWPLIAANQPCQLALLNSAPHQPLQFPAENQLNASCSSQHLFRSCYLVAIVSSRVSIAALLKNDSLGYGK